MGNLTDVYTDTRNSAGRLPTWWVRCWARRARWAVNASRYGNNNAQVRLVALEHELTTRGVSGHAPRPGQRFHRLG